MKVAVATFSKGDEYKKVTYLGRVSLNIYCKKNHYDIIDDPEYDESRPIYWAKIPLLIKIIESKKYDYVVWIDADTIIMNDNLKLETIIEKYLHEKGKNILMCIDNGLQFNTGVWFFKCDDYSKEILELTYNQTEFINNRLPEQDSFYSLHSKNISNLQEKCVILPNYLQHEFNSSMYDYKKNGLLVHFLGIYKKEWMLEVMTNHFPYRLINENSWDYTVRKNHIKKRYPDYNKPLKIAICSFAIGDKYKECMNLGIESKVKYCKKHGYDFIDDESVYHEQGKDRPIAWSKILMVKKYLPYYDYVVWMDADTMITNDEIKLEDYIKEHLDTREFLFTRDISHKINSGVFFVKYSYLSFQFLDLIYSKEEYIDSHTWEQEAINYIHDKNVDNFHEYSIILPVEKQHLFNCCIGLYKQGMFLIHFYGPRNMDWVSKGMKDFCPWKREDEDDHVYNNRKDWLIRRG